MGSRSKTYKILGSTVLANACLRRGLQHRREPGGQEAFGTTTGVEQKRTNRSKVRNRLQAELTQKACLRRGAQHRRHSGV